jgi:hypothetical protein
MLTAEQKKFKIQRLMMKCLHWLLHQDHLSILESLALRFL